MNNHAISYLRFSSAKQKEGDSYARQHEAIKKFCEQNNLIIIDDFEDEGVSGWNEDNLDETAAFGRIIKMIKSGKIKKGTTIVVENLDRITRANTMRALNIISEIILSGINIATTTDGKIYSEKSEAFDSTIASLILTRGNGESELKSKRVKHAWEKKRNQIRDGKFVKLSQHPNWLKINNDQYVEDENSSKIVKRIFEMYISGLGSHLIAKTLNKEKITPFSRTGKTFTFSSIERLLKNTAVIGRCEIVNPPKNDYYPRIITDSVWYQAQSMREKNNHYKGSRNDINKINFLGGLMVCVKCGGSFVRYSCKAPNNQRYHYVVCRNAKYGEHKLELVPYSKMETIIVIGLQHHDFLNLFIEKIHDPVSRDKLDELNGRLIEKRNEIKFITDSILETKSKSLLSALRKLETEEIEIESEIESEKTKIEDYEIKIKSKENLDIIIDNLDDNKMRMKLRNFLRTIIDRVELMKLSRGNFFGKIRFKDSNDFIVFQMLIINKSMAKFYLGKNISFDEAEMAGLAAGEEIQRQELSQVFEKLDSLIKTQKSHIQMTDCI